MKEWHCTGKHLPAAARQTESDRETLRVAAELRDLAVGVAGSTARGEDDEGSGSSSAPWVDVPVLGEVPVPRMPTVPVDAELLRELAELAPELAPGAQAAALRFGSVLLDQAAERVAAAEAEDKAIREA